ncbi:MAG: NAD(P)H-dependent oxidoreductase [Reichenbachiella sp.]|uniref:NADPH-dependent FMN reductase n=1 Tax=Reichenbachiella sp. TaxID=2184521 RepID=UPI003296FB81
MKNILAISGSIRQNSSNHVVLQYIGEKFCNEIDMELYQGIDQLPHFNPDYDKEPSAEVVEFRKKIESADGIIICTPEYVFSLPGSLKNAIEWLVSTTALSGKPVALIVAAASGHKALESLDLIMTTLEANIPADCKLLIQGVKGKINSEGQLNDVDTKNKIEHNMKSFLSSLS